MSDSPLPPTAAAPKSPAQESPTTALFRSAIGPVNSDYYLPILTRFESLGRSGLSWSWAAGLYTLNWMVYRRLWRQAAIYLAALICILATAVIMQLVAQPSLPMQAGGVLTLLGFAIGIPGLLGNAWLYADIHNRMTQAIATSKTMAEAGLVLSQQASTRQGFIRQLVANAAIVGVAVVGYLLIPSSGKAITPPAPTSVAPMASAPTSLPVVAASAATIATAASIPLPALPPASEPVVVAPAPVVLAAPPQATTPLANPAPKKAEKQEPAAKPKAHASRPDSDAAPRTAYFVNVGLFSKEQNASAAISQLVAAGMTGTTQRVDVGSKKLTRVRSGPYETQADATEVAVKIRLLNLEAKVFAQKQP